MESKCEYCGVLLKEGEECQPSRQNCMNLMEFYEKFDKDYHN